MRRLSLSLVISLVICVGCIGGDDVPEVRSNPFDAGSATDATDAPWRDEGADTGRRTEHAGDSGAGEGVPECQEGHEWADGACHPRQGQGTQPCPHGHEWVGGECRPNPGEGAGEGEGEGESECPDGLTEVAGRCLPISPSGEGEGEGEGGAAEGEGEGDHPTPLAPFNQAHFMSTHNSYEGGLRRSVRDQLDHGVRGLEFDIHDDDFGSVGDYRVGHDDPGDRVVRGGENPASDRLREWLMVVAQWSTANPEHAPITLTLDIKDDLTDNASGAEGNLGALNAILRATFGDRLQMARTAPARESVWPSVDDLRGRVLIVLSGHERSRWLYGRDTGVSPAVAMNAAGDVLEVHHSSRNELWYWRGVMEDGVVRWREHARYDRGRDPAVAMVGDVILEVHRSHTHDTLWYRIGRLSADGLSVSWGSSRRYDDGIKPTVQLADDLSLTEIHQSQNNEQRWTWAGRVDPERSVVEWGAHGRTDRPFFSRDRAHAEEDDVFVRVWTRERDSILRYATADVDDGAIAYEPVAFVEIQSPDVVWADARSMFFATNVDSEGADGFVGQWQGRGGLVRLWGYNEPGRLPLPNFPATDEPFAPWYIELLAGAAR